MTTPKRRSLPQPSRASDAEILVRLSAGEIGALGELYDRHQGPVRRFVARATSDAEDVDDLVHATFLTAAKSASRYDGRESSRPWLIGIAARLLRRRHVGFARLLEVLSSLRSTRSPLVDPHGALDARKDIEKALRKLSEPKRVTILMAEVEGLTCAEIAEALDVPIGTVWTRLHTARRELRELLVETSDSPTDGGPR